MASKFQCLREELHGSSVVFCDTYADSTLSEKHLREKCNLIAIELDKNEMKFAAFDGGFYMEIMVEPGYELEIKQIAESSGISAWVSFLEKQKAERNKSIRS
jgi:hypothetical protein